MYEVPPPLTRVEVKALFDLFAKAPRLKPDPPWGIGPKPPHWDEDIDELIAHQTAVRKARRRAHLRVVK